MPSPEHDARIARLQAALATRGLSGALLLQAVDVLYFSGTRQNGALWVPAAGAPVLLVRKSAARARAEASVADVRPFPRSSELAGALGAQGPVGVPFDAVPAATLEWWRKQLPAASLVDASALVRELRSVKSAAELATLRAGGARISGVFAAIPSLLREGMTELELSAAVEHRLRLAGALGAPRLRAFNAELTTGVVVAGGSAAEPGFFDGPVVGRGAHASYPIGASARPIRRGEPVLVDFAAPFEGYVLDVSRTAVIGELPPALARAFDVAREISDEVAGALVPGAIPSAIWERAKAHAAEAGLGDRFMGPPGDQARFVGHGVGLELDELPVLAPGFDAPLVAGQVLAVEPKFVFAEGAVGVENTWAVREGGGEKLTPLADALLRA